MSTSHDGNGLNPARQLRRAADNALAAAVPQTATTDLAPNLALPWVLRLRYFMVAGEAAIIVAMAYVFRLDFPVVWTLTPLAAILASNFLLSRMRDTSGRFPQETLGAAFVLDTLGLTVILGLTGGPANPFSLLYLVQITLSVVVLHKTTPITSRNLGINLAQHSGVHSAPTDSRKDSKQKELTEKERG